MDMKINDQALFPFTMEAAAKLVQSGEDMWNTRDAAKVCMCYSMDSEWRDGTEFINGREEIRNFLTRKWKNELDSRLKKELWGFRNNRMAVRLEYEWHDHNGQWFRSYGNELLEYDEAGLIKRRFVTSNHLPVDVAELT